MPFRFGGIANARGGGMGRSYFLEVPLRLCLNRAGHAQWAAAATLRRAHTMVASVQSCLLRGLKGQLVEVQVDVSSGKTGFRLVGLGDAGVKEARERVRSAIRNSLLPFPLQRLTVNLAPAELRKEGSGFDLPVAVAISLAMA